MDFWNYLLRLIKREPSVVSLVSSFDKQRVKLEAAAQRLKELAKAKEAAAALLVKRAEAHAADGKWANDIAERFEALTKR